MTQAWSVIVGIDFSDASRRALEVAIDVSVHASAPLELVYVWDSHVPEPSESAEPAVEYWIRDQKELLATRLNEWAAEAKQSGANATCRITDGDPPKAITEVSRSLGGGLIIVGRRGAANLAHVVLGSVSERVTLLAESPVLVVPEKTRFLHSPKRLLVGVDLSENSTSASQAAISIARRVGATHGLVLAHVGPNKGGLALPDKDGVDPEASPDGENVDFEQWANRLETDDLPLETRILEGNVAAAVMTEARNSECDWIVLGVQGRTALAAFLMGGTTERILKLSSRPVLVVPKVVSENTQSEPAP